MLLRLDEYRASEVKEVHHRRVRLAFPHGVIWPYLKQALEDDDEVVRELVAVLARLLCAEACAQEGLGGRCVQQIVQRSDDVVVDAAVPLVLALAVLAVFAYAPLDLRHQLFEMGIIIFYHHLHEVRDDCMVKQFALLRFERALHAGVESSESLVQKALALFWR